MSSVPLVAVMDLAFVRRFSIGSAVLETRLEACDLFNRTNFDEYVGALLSPLFAQPVSAFPKRQIQLAAIGTSSRSPAPAIPERACVTDPAVRCGRRER